MADQDAVIRHAQADLANVPGATGKFIEIEGGRNTAPSTSSVLWGAWREGLKDLQNAVINPDNTFVATHEEIGTIANPTQIEVTKDRESYQSMLDQARGSIYGQEQEKEIER